MTDNDIVCKKCKGHGSLEGVVADNEVAPDAGDSDLAAEWGGVDAP